jgi:hypothetical protein
MSRIRSSVIDFINGDSRTRTGWEVEGTIKQGGKLQMTVCFHLLSPSWSVAAPKLRKARYLLIIDPYVRRNFIRRTGARITQHMPQGRDISSRGASNAPLAVSIRVREPRPFPLTIRSEKAFALENHHIRVAIVRLKDASHTADLPRW